MSKAVVAAVLVALAALAGPALGATTQNITITVTVEYLSVSVDTATVAMGSMAANATKIGSPVINVTNDGNVAENIALRIGDEDDLDAWTSAATAAENVYVLFGLIVNDGAAAPVAGDCGADDVLTTTAKYWAGGGTAANSQLAATDATATPVAAAGVCDLYFGLTAPSSVTGATAAQQHSITAELSVTKD